MGLLLSVWDGLDFESICFPGYFKMGWFFLFKAIKSAGC
jgi:hypothetical protein